jgi:hypothetical protein
MAWDGDARASVPVASASEATATVAILVRRAREDWFSEMTTPGVKVRQEQGRLAPA